MCTDLKVACNGTDIVPLMLCLEPFNYSVDPINLMVARCMQQLCKNLGGICSHACERDHCIGTSMSPHFKGNWLLCTLLETEPPRPKQSCETYLSSQICGKALLSLNLVMTLAGLRSESSCFGILARP